MKLRIVLGLAVVRSRWSAPQAAPFVDAMRGPTPITATTEPPRLGNAVNDDNRLQRNYSYQPPIIPHRIDGYQVDKNFNKCLDCHAREKTAFSQAIPVSTHALHRPQRQGARPHLHPALLLQAVPCGAGERAAARRQRLPRRPRGRRLPAAKK